MATSAVAKAKKEMKEKLITILQNDFNFDAIGKMIDLYHKVARSRMKKAEKYKFEFQILSKIWEFSLPKLRVEENRNETGDQIQFNIMLGAPAPEALPGNKSNKNISIPTVVDSDGNFVIDIDKQ